MKSIYQKLNYLATSTAPDYNNGYMKGNLIRLTIGDYLYIVPGFISDLTYTIPEESPWEIAFSSPEGREESIGLMETPKLIEVQVSFTPIHDFAPRLDSTKQAALITPQSQGSNNKYLGNSGSYVTPKVDIEAGKGNMEPFATDYTIKIVEPTQTTPQPLVPPLPPPGPELNI
jgi:hypothetical protein